MAISRINLRGKLGLRGTQGLPGPVGPLGPQGPIGPQGPQGPQGLQGATGPKGDTGATGPQGTAGTGVTIKGSLASSANLPATGAAGDGYLISGNLWVWTGSAWQNVGTIQGPKGDTGATGPQGPQGPQGAQGIQGAKGDTGAQGPAGPSVADGDKGDITVSGSGLTWTIDAQAVTNTKLAQVANNTLKGNASGAPSTPQDLSPSTVRGMLALGWSTVQTTAVAADAAVVDFTLPSAISRFRFEIDAYATTDNVFLIALVSRDGGATWINSAGAYTRSIFLHSGATVTASANVTNTYAHLSNSQTNTATVGLQATINVFKGDTTRYPLLKSVYTAYVPSVGYGSGIFANYVGSVGAINKIRLQFNSGNIRAGSVFTLEGLNA